MTTKLEQQKVTLESELDKIKAKISVQNSRKTVLCGCGKYHRICDLTRVIEQVYTSPHGCSGGDYWSDGEQQFLCLDIPTLYIRLMNNTKYTIIYSQRNLLENDIIAQFSKTYGPLFKETFRWDSKDYKQAGRTEFINSHYLSTKAAMAKFNLSIKYPCVA